MNNKLNGFIESLKEREPDDKKKNLRLEVLNFEAVKAESIGNGILTLPDIARLYEYTKAILAERAYQIEFFVKNHPDSPNYWMKDLENDFRVIEEGDGINYEVGAKLYNTGLALDDFFEQTKEQKKSIKERESYIPDNYELAEKVLKEFRKIPANKKYKLEDVSYRETAMWESTDFEAIKTLSDFIQKKYINPKLKKMLKSLNIIEFKFTKKEGRNALDITCK